MRCLIDRLAEIKTNNQIAINQICPSESVEHHREHRCRNREIYRFCLGSISNYWEISYRCIAEHYPVWAGSLHLKILWLMFLFNKRKKGTSIFHIKSKVWDQLVFCGDADGETADRRKNTAPDVRNNSAESSKTLSSIVVQEIIMTTSGTAIDYKVVCCFSFRLTSVAPSRHSM